MMNINDNSSKQIFKRRVLEIQALLDCQSSIAKEEVIKIFRELPGIVELLQLFFGSFVNFLEGKKKTGGFWYCHIFAGMLCFHQSFFVDLHIESYPRAREMLGEYKFVTQFLLRHSKLVKILIFSQEMRRALEAHTKASTQIMYFFMYEFSPTEILELLVLWVLVVGKRQLTQNSVSWERRVVSVWKRWTNADSRMLRSLRLEKKYKIVSGLTDLAQLVQRWEEEIEIMEENDSHTHRQSEGEGRLERIYMEYPEEVDKIVDQLLNYRGIIEDIALHKRLRFHNMLYDQGQIVSLHPSLWKPLVYVDFQQIFSA
eukprot:Gb_40880 [translate_table: standard]